MKTKDALDIIKKIETKPKFKSNKKGFMISFEVIEGHTLRSDHFPDKHANQKLISTEEEAWNLGKRFASATDNTIVNIYVIDESFNPVKDYSFKILKHYC